MTTKIEQGVTDIYTVLDYYTKSALSHSSYILVCFFGIFSILTVIIGFNKIYDPFTFFWTYLIFVGAYALIVSFGLYEIHRWKFYSSRAKDIANFIKDRLKGNDKFRKHFCEALKKKKEWYDDELLIDEWIAVGKKDKERAPISRLFDIAEWLFFAFCTVILVGLFIGVYNGEIVNALCSAWSFLCPPRFLSCIIIIVVYALISIVTICLLREISGMIKEGEMTKTVQKGK